MQELTYVARRMSPSSATGRNTIPCPRGRYRYVGAYSPGVHVRDTQLGVKSSGITTHKNAVRTAMRLKNAGFEALRDVTHLPGCSRGDKDRTKLDHRRVSMASLARPQFQSFSEEEQAIYVRHLAG